jgi:hypothetical protein
VGLWRRDAWRRGDEVDAEHGFGDRMLAEKPGAYHEEVERAVRGSTSNSTVPALR